MSSVDEGRAAAEAATQTGKSVWVCWTLHEDRSGRLRSEEDIDEAAKALSDLPVSGVLANCCAPESITNAMPQLAQTGSKPSLIVKKVRLHLHRQPVIIIKTSRALKANS